MKQQEVNLKENVQNCLLLNILRRLRAIQKGVACSIKIQNCYFSKRLEEYCTTDGLQKTQKTLDQHTLPTVQTKKKKKHPCCALHFTQHACHIGSRKWDVPYLKIQAVCKFSTCNTQYSFTMLKESNQLCYSITITVRRTGSIHHLKTVTIYTSKQYTTRKNSQSYFLGCKPDLQQNIKIIRLLISGNLTQSLNKTYLSLLLLK